METYRFRLDSSSKKYTCPRCGQKRFVRYTDTETGQLTLPEYGRCDREQKCGYHLKPTRDAIQCSHRYSEGVQAILNEKQTAEQTSYISRDLFSRSLVTHVDNNFILYLENIFSADIVHRLIERYHIGTSKHWPGSTVFWQVDQAGGVRTGKVMQYDSETGRRVKKPFNHVTWVHSILKLKPFNLKQCLFGEHLLKQHPSSPVAITESEKSAILASVYLPECIWLSTGQKNGLTVDKYRVLSGRDVLLYPDLGAYEDWKARAEKLRQQIPNVSIRIIDLLEKTACEADREQGLDIADYLTRYPYIEPFCYEDRKRNPWPGSSYWTMSGSGGYEYIWEKVKTPNGWKIRAIESRMISSNRNAA